MGGVVGESGGHRGHGPHPGLGSATRPPRAVGARDEPQHGVAVVGVDHGGEKSAGGLVRVRTKLGERARDARGLQPRELHRQGLALRGYVEPALAAALGALLLHHVALIAEWIELAAAWTI